MEKSSNNKSALPIVLFTLAAFLLGALGVRFLGHLNRDQPTVDTKRAELRIQARQKLDTEDAIRLQATEWVDDSRETARIPITRAMEMMVTELRLKPVGASSVEVPPPIVQAEVAPAAAEDSGAAPTAAPSEADSPAEPAPPTATPEASPALEEQAPETPAPAEAGNAPDPTEETTP